jgi:hypothetical protein
MEGDMSQAMRANQENRRQNDELRARVASQPFSMGDLAGRLGFGGGGNYGMQQRQMPYQNNDIMSQMFAS